MKIEVNLGQNQEYQWGHTKFETWRSPVGTCACMSLQKAWHLKPSGPDQISKEESIATADGLTILRAIFSTYTEFLCWASSQKLQMGIITIIMVNPTE